MEAREKLGLTIKDVSMRLRIPQYRLKAVETGRNYELLPEVLEKYTSFLGLDSWISKWKSANPELALRLGLMERDGEA